MMKRMMLAAVLLAVSVFYALPAEAIVHVEGRYWFTTLESNVKATDLGVIGSEINLVDTLGVDDKKNFWEARVDLNLGSHHLRYGYMPLSWDGQKTITQSINFDGKTYSASARVDSNLDITYQRLGYRYNIIDTLGNQLGIIFDIKLFDIEARLKTTGIDESYSVTAPVPTIGLGAQIGLPFLFTVGAEVTGIAYSGNHLIDGEAAINFNPIPFITISGGYRLFDLKVEDGDDKVDFSLKGPFLMVNAGF